MSEEKKEKKFFASDTYSLGLLPENKNIRVLMKNGQNCKCHKVSAFLLPGDIQGTLNKMYEPCSSACSRFELGEIKESEQDTEGVFVVKQTCEAIGKTFPLTNVVDKSTLIPEQKKSNLLMN